MSFPNTSDNNFYNKINKHYHKYLASKKKKTFKQICYPKSYELQLPQIFLSKYINPNTPYKGILIFHQIGSGKTCTSIQIAEAWKNYRKIMVVVPASLIGNYRNELRSNCAESKYLKSSERKLLKQYHPMSKEYKAIIQKSDDRIDKVYRIYSYNKFIQLADEKELNLRNTLLIIDEIQNMVSEGGKYYEVLENTINNSPSELRVVLLSATPMFDKPNEIALTLNLLRLPIALPVGTEFDKTFLVAIKRKNGLVYQSKNLDLFKELIKGYVSYFRGADPISFPELKLKYIKCDLSDFQYRAYATVMKQEDRGDRFKEYRKSVRLIKNGAIVGLPNNFFIGTRMVSNVAFPNNDVGIDGLESLTQYKVNHHLEIYSIKFYKILKKISKCHGKILIYSTFRSYGGLESLIKILELSGYKNYEEFGGGRKRFGVFSGDENLTEKERIKEVYNREDNIYGDKLKILLLSPAAREGLSLFNVRQLHIVEPYWNFQRVSQILGRAVRYCSHKELPEDLRVVNAYIYIATHPNEKETVDQYIAKLAQKKSVIIQEFEDALKESAIDCHLFKNMNHLEGLKCDI